MNPGHHPADDEQTIEDLPTSEEYRDYARRQNFAYSGEYARWFRSLPKEDRDKLTVDGLDAPMIERSGKHNSNSAEPTDGMTAVFDDPVDHLEPIETIDDTLTTRIRLAALNFVLRRETRSFAAVAAELHVSRQAVAKVVSQISASLRIPTLREGAKPTYRARAKAVHRRTRKNRPIDMPARVGRGRKTDNRRK